MVILFSVWAFLAFILLLVIIAGAYVFLVKVPPAVIRAGTSLGLPLKQIWTLYNLDIPVVQFTNSLKKAEKAGIELDFDDLVEFFQFHGDKVNGYVDYLIAFQETGVKVPRDTIVNHYLSGADPSTLKTLKGISEKAELNIDWSMFLKSGISGADQRLYIDALIRSHKAGLYVSKDELSAIDPDTRESIENDIVTQTGLLDHYAANIDVGKYVDAMILAKRTGIKITKEALDLHYLTDGDMLKLVTNMIRLKKAEIEVDEVILMQQKLVGGDMDKLVNALIRAKTANLNDITIHDLIDFHLTGGDVDDYVVALDTIENNQLDLTKEDIIQHALAKGNIVGFTKALAIVKKNALAIPKEKIETDSFNGYNVADLLSVAVSSKGTAYEMDYAFAMKVSAKGTKPQEVIDWVITPQVLRVEPHPAVVAQNGIQVIPHVTVTLRGKITQYFSSSREEIIFSRVREAIITEMETFGTHDDILHNLEWISKRILYQLQGRQELPRLKYKSQKSLEDDIGANNKKEYLLNDDSAYEIIDISIYDIEIGKDIYRDMREREAEFNRLMSRKESEKRISIARAEEEEAKARLIQSRAKLHEGMAKGFEAGKGSTKEYLKGEIFGYSGDEDDK